MTAKKTAKEAKPATVFANEPGAEGEAEGHQRPAVRSLEQHPRQPDRPRALAQARQARNEPRPKQRPPLRALRGPSEALREAVAESKLAYERQQLQLLVFERLSGRGAGARSAARSSRGELLLRKFATQYFVPNGLIEEIRYVDLRSDLAE